MSDVKDEIDWEFPGATTTEGQSNFFWQGVIRMLRFIWIWMDFSCFFWQQQPSQTEGLTAASLTHSAIITTTR